MIRHILCNQNYKSLLKTLNSPIVTTGMGILAFRFSKYFCFPDLSSIFLMSLKCLLSPGHVFIRSFCREVVQFYVVRKVPGLSWVTKCIHSPLMAHHAYMAEYKWRYRYSSRLFHRLVNSGKRHKAHSDRSKNEQNLEKDEEPHHGFSWIIDTFSTMFRP